MGNSLSDKQFDALIKIVQDELAQTEFPVPSASQSERKFTGAYVLPRLREIVSKTRENRIVVHGDGAHPALRMNVAGMQFCPDAEFKINGERLLAFEVKLIRPGDPSGSFAKAIGQAVSYRSLGYDAAFVLAFDTRPRHLLTTSSLKSKIEAVTHGVYTYFW